MRKSLEDIYLIILLFLYNLMLVDITVFGFSLKILLLLVATLVVILIHTLKRSDERIEWQISYLDIAIAAICICGLAVFVYKLIMNPLDNEKTMVIMTLCLLYYLIRIRKEPVSKDIVFLFSISNAVIEIMLLWHYIVNMDTPLPIELLLENNTILSWLILVITVNVVSYCIYEGKEIWYGANAVIGFFLLFIQKNIVAIGIVGAFFLFLPLVYMPTKRLVNSAMQMFFIYGFLLCNMSLITGYTEIIKIELIYDLETSVYLELLLAVFGVFFFHYWDKNTTEEDDGRKLLPELREYMQKALCIIGIMTVLFMGAVVKEGTAIMPDVCAKLIEQGKRSFHSQSGIFETVVLEYGGIGVVLVLYLYFTLAYSLQKKKKPKVTRHHKLFRIITGMFVVQSLFLTQSMVTLPLYLVFVISFLKDTDLFEKKERGKDTNEVDYSDSVL